MIGVCAAHCHMANGIIMILDSIRTRLKRTQPTTICNVSSC